MTLYGNTVLTNPNVYCIVTPLGGCATIISAAKGVHGTSKQASPNVKNVIAGVIIYPNPTTGNFSIKVDNFKETAVAVITDITGKQIATYNLVKGDNKIQNEGLAKGTYLVVLKIDGKQETTKIVIK